MSQIIGRGRYARETYPVRAQGGGAPSSPIPPLVTAFWVDRETATPIADRDGSIENPFADIDEAELAAHVPAYAALILTPNGVGGVYTQGATFTKAFSYNGLGSLTPFQTSPPGQPGNSNISIECDQSDEPAPMVRNCRATLNGLGTRSYSFRDCRISGVDYAGSADFIDCVITGNIALSSVMSEASSHANNSTILSNSITIRNSPEIDGGDWTAELITLTDCCNIEGIGLVLNGLDVELSNCEGTITGINISENGSVRMRQVRFVNTESPLLITLADAGNCEVFSDRFSLATFWATGGDFVLTVGTTTNLQVTDGYDPHFFGNGGGIAAGEYMAPGTIILGTIPGTEADGRVIVSRRKLLNFRLERRNGAGALEPPAGDQTFHVRVGGASVATITLTAAGTGIVTGAFTGANGIDVQESDGLAILTDDDDVTATYTMLIQSVPY